MALPNLDWAHMDKLQKQWKKSVKLEGTPEKNLQLIEEQE